MFRQIESFFFSGTGSGSSRLGLASDLGLDYGTAVYDSSWSPNTASTASASSYYEASSDASGGESYYSYYSGTASASASGSSGGLSSSAAAYSSSGYARFRFVGGSMPLAFEVNLLTHTGTFPLPVPVLMQRRGD